MRKCRAVALSAAFASSFAAASATAQDESSGAEPGEAREGVETEAGTVAANVAERPANEGRVGEMHFRLVNEAGAERTREALMIHSDTGDVVKLGIFFTAPAAIRDTGFLSHDADEGADENWLFLPAIERVRRLPSADRADYFMGTDLTYGDISDDFKFELEQWRFSGGETVSRDGVAHATLNGEAASAEAIAENGYSRFEALVDTTTWFPVLTTYHDAEGEALKRIEVLEQERIGGAWTAMRFVVENLQSGHTTYIHFEDMRYVPDLDEEMLEPDALEYGVPVID